MALIDVVGAMPTKAARRLVLGVHRMRRQWACEVEAAGSARVRPGFRCSCCRRRPEEPWELDRRPVIRLRSASDLAGPSRPWRQAVPCCAGRSTDRWRCHSRAAPPRMAEGEDCTRCCSAACSGSRTHPLPRALSWEISAMGEAARRSCTSIALARRKPEPSPERCSAGSVVDGGYVGHFAQTLLARCVARSSRGPQRLVGGVGQVRTSMLIGRRGGAIRAEPPGSRAKPTDQLRPR